MSGYETTALVDTLGANLERPGLHLVVGRPGHAMTSAAEGLAARALQRGRDVLFLSLHREAAEITTPLPAAIVSTGAISVTDVGDALRDLAPGALVLLSYFNLLGRTTTDGRYLELSAVLEALASVAERAAATLVAVGYGGREAWPAGESAGALPTWATRAHSAAWWCHGAANALAE